MRTPLTAVKLHADRALDADTLDVARHALREVQTAADRAVRLSNQLLSLARAEPGLSLERLGPVEHFDLAELAFEIGAEWVRAGAGPARGPGLRDPARSHLHRRRAGHGTGQPAADARGAHAT